MAARLAAATPEAASALRTYKAVLGVNMALHMVVGVACIGFPVWVSSTVGLPPPGPDGWTRGWGATLMLVTTLYVPGQLDPLGVRAPNYIGILGRYWMMSIWIFCGGGFLWFALFDGVWGTLIGALYLRLLRLQDRAAPPVAA